MESIESWSGKTNRVRATFADVNLHIGAGLQMVECLPLEIRMPGQCVGHHVLFAGDVLNVLDLELFEYCQPTRLNPFKLALLQEPTQRGMVGFHHERSHAREIVTKR